MKFVALGILQGLTEFLPISSSGHLAVFEHYLRFHEPLFWIVFAHFGSLVALVLLIWRKIGILRRYAMKSLLLWVVIATMPAAVVGLCFYDLFEKIAGSVKLISILWIINGIILILTRKLRRPYTSLSLKNTFVVGLAQALALLPGISRSGVTISTALFLGIKEDDAVGFSILLSLPAILGANVVEFMKVKVMPHVVSLLSLFLASFVTSYLALVLLIIVTRRRKLHLFGIYTVALGVGLLLIDTIGLL